MHHNDDNMTAEDLLKKGHGVMLREAKECTCSSVSVLVATVVFAAAYTVPGGYDQSGLPIFLGTPVFLFFTIMDVVALASSLPSVVLFLSVLTSPFGMKDLERSLPRKLFAGIWFDVLLIDHRNANIQSNCFADHQIGEGEVDFNFSI
ncbi:hypothetical protein L6164_002911 [Bauhinia variegata]|uniref:Uncharacterized protein n=1 Tax=Bauhinia variegata TaxID=167791 RepID=A0ACB9PZK7_BAUVA|nr:hypothetical protein L6164_002911 [Bauhinia variegata]